MGGAGRYYLTKYDNLIPVIKRTVKISAMGTDRLGSLASSLPTVMASYPVYAKYAREAPSNTEETPFGRKSFVQLGQSAKMKPITTTNKSVRRFRLDKTLFTTVVCRIPKKTKNEISLTKYEVIGTKVKRRHSKMS